MKYLERNYSDILSINQTGISFADGFCIRFEECVNNQYSSPTCVAERDITANPPYFSFFTSGKPTHIIFTALAALQQFTQLQMLLTRLGFTSLDLS